MRRGAAAAIVAAAMIATAWAAESPGVAEVRRRREESRWRVATATAALSRLTSGTAAERETMPPAVMEDPGPFSSVSLAETRLLTASRELAAAERALAVALRRAADAELRSASGDFPLDLGRLVSMLREADCCDSLESRFPTPEPAVLRAVASLASQPARAVDPAEVEAVLSGFREQLAWLRQAAIEEEREIAVRRAGLISQGARGAAPAGIRDYLEELESRAIFLRGRVSEYGQLLP